MQAETWSSVRACGPRALLTRNCPFVDLQRREGYRVTFWPLSTSRDSAHPTMLGLPADL